MSRRFITAYCINFVVNTKSIKIKFLWKNTTYFKKDLLFRTFVFCVLFVCLQLKEKTMILQKMFIEIGSKEVL